MKPRIHVITLAVADLDCALAFYRGGLGFQTEGLIGTEFTGNQTISRRDHGGVLPRRRAHADDISALRARQRRPGPLTAAKPGEFGIGHVVASRPEVDEVIARAQAAGATVTDPPHDRPWGIYSGYFQDPDGQLWEVIWNPALDLASY